uniref:Uncharacterized protein n=1 Tax=Pavo cristatus TaxID=9049 RepID=A0A8C9G0L0_PAVCR
MSREPPQPPPGGGAGPQITGLQRDGGRGTALSARPGGPGVPHPRERNRRSPPPRGSGHLRGPRRYRAEQLVARSLAAMPARIAAWRQEKEQMRERSRQDAARRQRLLAEAAERLGAPVRPGDPRVQALMQDLERERRRQEKRQRRQQHEEAARSALAAAEAGRRAGGAPWSP